MSNYRDEIAAEIIARIEAGTAPWLKPWRAGALGVGPFNPITGKPYRGINDLWLGMQGRADPRWMTYRQASQAEAQVRKGEKSTTIEYWQWTDRTAVKDADGKAVLDAEGQQQYETVRLDRPKVFLAKVFNAEQIDGLAPYVAPAPAFDPIKRAEAIIEGAGIPVLHDQHDRAFYRPSTDKIHLPPMAMFHNAASYYDTALHELGHATGHPSRLNREFGPFGSEVYAREELKAEIASYMLARDMGISFDPSNHAAYVESWLKVLREDKNEIFRAARDAEIIKTWVMEPERRPELERGAGQGLAVLAQAQTVEVPKELRLYIKELEAAGTPEERRAAVERYGISPKSVTEFVEFAVKQAAEDRLTNQAISDYLSRQTEIAESAAFAQADRFQETQEKAMSKIYIAVPYDEKNEAKAAGAKWDRGAKSWYVPEGTDPAAFSKWATAAKAPAPELSPVEEFAQALKTHGLIVKGDPVMDGQWHRCPVEGDKAKQMSGSYIGYLDGRPSGNITNYRAGGTTKWVAAGVSLTDAERAHIQAEAANVRAAREAERLAAAEKAAKNAYGVWQNLPGEANPENSPYLAAKGVKGHGVKVNGEGHMIIPCRDAAGRLWNIQTVTPENKLFLRDSRKEGTFHVLEVTGKGTLDALLPLKQGVIIIAEGYATAATIFEETGRPVISAFDSSNLKAVAEAVRAKFPDRPILIAGDNDHANVHGNVGMVKAEEAAKAVGGKMVAPSFTAEEKAQKLTDFNDLHQSRGAGWVRRTIEGALSKAQGQERGIA
ncbi:DNA primase traC [Magnetospirillum gryphiswaldense MSR-1 v2]|uniref:DNA primase traC n=2 Tax=Magnetospirillum gryphiswaldense TaxID=55518 RepID=V6F5Q4_MAGGM|nr:zincin-like metallopeptidase domain-containing protein [Magnetospirillum gryphiswaldense]CAM77714.1 protein (antirestriction protein) [Magnetospirillum gryphiswaldense MSR-1]CDK99661.1 DNA primase traC [Magnetospirillum gryphiswaldense MSR-1 v2]